MEANRRPRETPNMRPISQADGPPTVPREVRREISGACSGWSCGVTRAVIKSPDPMGSCSGTHPAFCPPEADVSHPRPGAPVVAIVKPGALDASPLAGLIVPLPRETLQDRADVRSSGR